VGILLTALLWAVGPGAAAEEAKAPEQEFRLDHDVARMQSVMREKMQRLSPLIGEWRFESRFEPDPRTGRPGFTATARESVTPIFDGLVLRSSMEMSIPEMGLTFRGLGFIGYDPRAGQYYAAWFDNSGEMAGIVLRGDFDDQGRLVVQGRARAPGGGDYQRKTFAFDGKRYDSWVELSPDGKTFQRIMTMKGVPAKEAPAGGADEKTTAKEEKPHPPLPPHLGKASPQIGALAGWLGHWTSVALLTLQPAHVLLPLDVLGQETITPTLGGHFIEDTFEGALREPPAPCRILALFGFDRGRDIYTVTLIDSLGLLGGWQLEGDFGEGERLVLQGLGEGAHSDEALRLTVQNEKGYLLRQLEYSADGGKTYQDILSLAGKSAGS
jgi:hypothetical protein